MTGFTKHIKFDYRRILISSVVLLCTTVFISGISYDVNYAEARLPTSPCYQQDYGKGLTLWIKISYNEETRKHVCQKTWDYFSDITESACNTGKYVNYCKVPEICGSEAGRVETDPDCKPKLKHTPLSEEPLPPSSSSSSQEELLDRDFDGIRNSQDVCPDEYAKTENGCPDVSTGTTQEQKSGATPEQKPDNPWQIVGIVIFALIALYLVYKIRKKAAEKVQKRREQERHDQERREQEKREREKKTEKDDLSKYYKILGLKLGASKKEIKAKYRELAKKHHSDKGGSDKKMKDVIEAYKKLFKKKKNMS